MQCILGPHNSLMGCRDRSNEDYTGEGNTRQNLMCSVKGFYSSTLYFLRAISHPTFEPPVILFTADWHEGV